MAINEEIREQKKKLKGKGVKAHLQWFWDYEKVPTLLVAVAVVVAISLIVSWVTYKPTAFGVLFINALQTDLDQADDLASGFIEYSGIDGNHNEVFTDLDETVAVGNSSSTAGTAGIYSQEKIMAESSAGQIDVAVMDLVNFNSYLSQGLFTDLRDHLDDTVLEEYAGTVYYVEGKTLQEMEEGQNDSGADLTEEAADSNTQTYQEWQAEQEKQAEELQSTESTENFVLPDASSMEDPVPVGIVVNDAPYFQKYHNYEGTVAVFGITSSGNHTEMAATFLEYLYEK